jgi:L-ascorbate metabolism protein UlaG (beta-lactamase superfamily)
MTHADRRLTALACVITAAALALLALVWGLADRPRPPTAHATAAQRTTPSAPSQLAPRTAHADLRTQWVGQGLVVVAMGPSRVLLDTASARTSTDGPTRQLPAPPPASELGHIDLVVLTGDGPSALDAPAAAALAARGAQFAVASAAAEARTTNWGVPVAQVHRVAPWSTAHLGEVELTPIPGDDDAPSSWPVASGRSSWVLASRSVQVLVPTGGAAAALDEAAEQLGPFDLTLVEPRASEPSGPLIAATFAFGR